MPYFFCSDCGTPVKCENCDVVLALHKGKFGEFLKCHVCGFSSDLPLTCANCGGTNLQGVGFGTQRVEQELSEILNFEVFRMDSDKIRSKGESLRILKEFGEGKIRVLVGTKMVVKGLDFPNVSLVVILNADEFLYRGGDFRAEERAMQILYQISGRIRKEGKLLIQTYNPNHPVLREFLRGKMKNSYERMYEERERSGLPPFRRMAIFEVRTSSEENDRINFKVLEDFVENYKFGTVWGPTHPPVRKIRGTYRVRVVVLGNDAREVSKVLSDLESLPLRGRKIFNVDPVHLD
ncbi:primosomal protein N' (replication factor Y) - superfamily II helicase [Thiovulum sp. ES]|nr:primosomal protein N' (replication factor Y) - superfamily II helicase [Thiovulum sp. ES]